MLESELQRKKELVARICVALKRRQEKMIKARSRFKHMARSLYWSVIWPSITSRYKIAMRTIAVLIYDAVNPFELGIATEVFGFERPEIGVLWYRS